MKGTISEIRSMTSSCLVGRSADEMEGNADVDILGKRGGGDGREGGSADDVSSPWKEQKKESSISSRDSSWVEIGPIAEQRGLTSCFRGDLGEGGRRGLRELERARRDASTSSLLLALVDRPPRSGLSARTKRFSCSVVLSNDLSRIRSRAQEDFFYLSSS